MRRIALSTAIGVVGLMVVSIGVCQTQPTIKLATPPVPLQNSLPLPPPFPPPLSTTLVPVTTLVPLSAQGHATATVAAVAVAEKMIVKVYSVPDLVAALQPHPASTIPGAILPDPETAVAMQQVQLYLQAAQKAVAPAAATAAPAVPDEITRKLERLKKALRVAAPKKTWTEDGGEGEIEVYPEALCLIIRQTAAGHEAIGDLLTQLRATQNIQIELTVEFVSFDGVADDLAAGAMKLLNRELSPEELAEFRKCGGKTAMSSVARMANGHSTISALSPGLPLQFTALTTADHSIVEFRTDFTLAMDAEDAADMAAMTQALSQVRSVAVGKTLAFMMGPEGEAVLLVTPKVIDRSTVAAK